jgi:hypothetical protein
LSPEYLGKTQSLDTTDRTIKFLSSNRAASDALFSRSENVVLTYKIFGVKNMKVMVSMLFVIFLLPLTAIAQRETSVCLDPSKNTRSTDAVILTVCNQGRGMTAPPALRLYFRLYQSGRVEYEIGDGNYKLKLKTTKIDAKAVAEIIKLGQEADFQNAKSEYPRIRIWTDSRLETTIIFKNQMQEKKILVNNYSSYDKENAGHYPASLLKMLKKIDELRPKDQ